MGGFGLPPARGRGGRNGKRDATHDGTNSIPPPPSFNPPTPTNSAIELDVDAIRDREGNVVICGVLEHIEQAGVHSGDSACSLPTQTIPEATLAIVRDWTRKVAEALRVEGLINIQYAVQDDVPYIIEANPRASRTVPFVAKAVGHPIAKYASLVMAGQTLKEIGFTEEPRPKHVAVKEVVLPFSKFPGADTLLGPEMRSTGEVMGIDADFASAYAKAQLAAGQKLPASGKVFMSMADKHKAEAVEVARELVGLGYTVAATRGTAAALRAGGVQGVEEVFKISEGRPNPADLLKNGDCTMMLITSGGDEPDLRDGRDLRRLALGLGVPLVTTLAGARATAAALTAMRAGPLKQVPLQTYFPDYRDASMHLMTGVAADERK